jgi:8-oxo-dGTP pyrophosphatase MutT (NUDIX family)
VPEHPASLGADLVRAAGQAGQNVRVNTEPADSVEPEIRTLASRVVYSDNWMRLRKDDIERADGSRGTYAVVERDDFAVIIPAENGGFYLVEEYRHPLGRRAWSFPQGTFPAGEQGTPEKLARTELAQETGLRAQRLTRLGALAANHGSSNQRGEYWLATGLTQGEPDLEPEELGMRHDWASRDEFEAMIRDGRIIDDSTLAGYALLLMAERRGEVTLP